MKQKTAAETYKARQSEINKILASIRTELEKHAQLENLSNENWGFSGDLGSVSAQLDDVLAFLAGSELRCRAGLTF